MLLAMLAKYEKYGTLSIYLGFKWTHDFGKYMSPVSAVFHTEVTVIDGLLMVKPLAYLC